MKILLVGHKGFIGSRLNKALEAVGHEVIGIDRQVGETIENHQPKEVDLVIHLAAQIDLQYSRKFPEDDAVNNIIDTIRLIKKYPDKKFIYPGTAASLPITSPYGLSKQTAVEYIKLLCPKYVILTLPNIWGGGHGVIDLFMKADVIKVNGDGHQQRTILHVDDVVRAFVQAIDWDTGEYKLGGQVMSVREIAERIAEKQGKEIQYDLDYNPTKEGEIYASIIPNTTPDFEPQITL